MGPHPGINVTAIFRVSKPAVPHLRARGGGRIINLGSIMSSTAGPSLAAYGTTKHAVAGLSKGMAVDLGKYRITVNTCSRVRSGPRCPSRS